MTPSVDICEDFASQCLRLSSVERFWFNRIQIPLQVYKYVGLQEGDF